MESQEKKQEKKTEKKRYGVTIDVPNFILEMMEYGRFLHCPTCGVAIAGCDLMEHAVIVAGSEDPDDERAPVFAVTEYTHTCPNCAEVSYIREQMERKIVCTITKREFNND